MKSYLIPSIAITFCFGWLLFRGMNYWVLGTGIIIFVLTTWEAWVSGKPENIAKEKLKNKRNNERN